MNIDRINSTWIGFYEHNKITFEIEIARDPQKSLAISLLLTVNDLRFRYSHPLIDIRILSRLYCQLLFNQT